MPRNVTHWLLIILLSVPVFPAFAEVDGTGNEIIPIGASKLFRVTSENLSTNYMILDPSSGNVGIGDSTPASLLTVGSGDLFQVNSSGDLVSIQGVTLDWPAANASGVLTNNGSGTLSWAAAASGDVTAVGDCASGACFTAAGTGDALTGATNDDVLSFATDATLIFQRNNAGTVTFTGADDAGAADTIYDTTGAGAITVGSADVTSVTVTTDGTGSAEVVLPTGAIESGEILDNTISGSDTADDTFDFVDLEDTLDLDASLTLNQTTNAWSQTYTGTATGLTYTANSVTSGGAVSIVSSATGLTGDLSKIELTGANTGNTGNVLKVGYTGTTGTATALNVTNAGTGLTARFNSDGTYADTGNPVVITAGGSLGVGISAPSKTLTVSGGTATGNSQVRVQYYSTSDNAGFYLQTNGTTYLANNSELFGGDWYAYATAVSGIILDSAGSLWFYTAASLIKDDVFTPTVRMSITSGGNVGIGDSTPASMLTVGSGDLFQVNSSGDLVSIQGVTLDWPAANASGVLTNNGSGTLSWAAAASGDVTAVGDCSTGACFGGASGTTLTSTTSEILDIGTANTLIFQRNDAGSVTFTGKDDAGAADTIYDTTGAGAITVGSADVTSVTVTTDGTGSAEVVLPTGAIESGEILDNTISGSDTADDTFDFVDFEDTLDLDANLTLNQTTSTWSQIFTGDTTTGLTYTANSLTSGTAVSVASSATGLTGDLSKIELTGANTGNTGNVLKVGYTGTTGTATALNVTNAGTGLTARFNDDGTYTDSTPFVIDGSGNVGIGDSTPDAYVEIENSTATGVQFLQTYTGLTSGAGQKIISDSLTWGQLLHLSTSGTAAEDNQKALLIELSGNNSASSVTTYGAYIDNTHSGVGSENIGLYVRAANGATTYGIVVDGGNVGIGDTTPAALLSVGSGDLFQVNSSGQVAAIAGLSGATGAYDLGGATSFEVPNAAAPTTDAAGEIALDTTITDHQPLLQYYDGGENMTVIAIDTAELPALDNEIIKYDAATDKFVLEADAGAGVSADSLDFIDFEDTLDLDANLTLNQTTNTWSQTFTGNTAVGLTYTANSLTSGTAVSVASSATGLTGDLSKIELTGANTGNTGNVFKVGYTGTTGTATALNVTNAGTGFTVRFNDDGTYADTTPFMIDQLGNVGIGTSAQYAGAGGAYQLYITSNAQQQLLLETTNVGAYAVQKYVTPSKIVQFTLGAASSAMPNKFYIWNESSSNAPLLVDTATDYVGIGDTDPAALFTVGSGDLFQVNTSGQIAAAAGITSTGVIDFGGATSTEIVNGAAPTTDAAGEIALDTTIVDHQPLLQYYDGGENMTVIAIDTAELPALDNEIIKYDAATDKFVLEADATGGVSADSLDFIDFEDTLDLDTGLTLNQATNPWEQSFTGDAGIGLKYVANSLTSGSAVSVASSATGLTGDLGKIELTGANTGNTGNVLKVGYTGTTGTATAVNVTNAGTGLSFRVNDDGTYTDSSPVVIDAAGDVGIGTSTPDAYLKIAAGTATANTAPLKLTSGTNLTTAEAGAVEYDGTAFYSSPVASNRGVSPSIHFTTNQADFTCNQNTVVQPIFEAARDRLTVAASTSYYFELFLSVTTGATTATKTLSFDGGTATFTSIRYSAIGQNAVLNTTGTAQSTVHADTAASVVVLATGTGSWWIKANGIMRINGGGTLLPQFRYSANPGTSCTVQNDSYMYLMPLGSNTVGSVGDWN